MPHAADHHRQARITLARAVYSKAQTLLLDDVLSALDVHTAKWIVDKCFELALLRAIPTTGQVVYDNQDVAKLNLEALRSSITLIPQQPEVSDQAFILALN